MTLNVFIFRFTGMVFIELNTSIAFISLLTVVRDHKLEHVSVYPCFFVVVVLFDLFTDLAALKVAFHS